MERWMGLCFLVLQLSSKSWTAPPSSATGRSLYREPTKQIPGPEKSYTGWRLSNTSQLVAYYHEQTIAVVELTDDRQLLNCELLEVKTKPDQDAALMTLRANRIKKYTQISLNNMIEVLNYCQQLAGPLPTARRKEATSPNQMQGRSLPSSFSTVFQGIFPGTKWCGRGDLAETYFDLGDEMAADKCCRTHDLCPVKVSAMTTQYNITNYSMVTRSHCICDKAFFRCLKKTKSSLTDLIGNLYFNVGDPQCVSDTTSQSNENVKTKMFKRNNLRY